jgi:hypothetical protein
LVELGNFHRNTKFALKKHFHFSADKPFKKGTLCFLACFNHLCAALVLDLRRHLFSPCCAATATRPVIGIVTQCDRRSARPEQAAAWLRLAGCEQIFFTSSKTGQGIDGLLDYLGTENKQNSTFL